MTARRLVLCLIAAPSLAWAQASQPVRGTLPKNDALPRVTLEEAKTAAQAKDGRVAAARAEAEAYAARVTLGPLGFLRGSYEGMLGPVTAQDGDAVNSSSGEFPLQPGNALGVFTRHELSLEVPIFTFGKITALSSLESLAKKAGDPLVERASADVAQDVRRAYYGALLADDLLDLLEEAQKQLEQGRAEVERGLAADSDDFSKTDLYKLEVAQGELRARAAEARAGLTLARDALGALTGAAGPVHPAEDFLALALGSLPALETLQASARENRPELRLLGLARDAKAAETKLNKAALLPDIGARFSGVFSASNVVENQPSPFAFDPFNQRFAMLGIGVRYSLDIGAKSAKAKESEAGRTQLEALQRAAQMGISLEIEKAYLDAKSASERFAAREEADKWARKWLLAVAADFTVGNAETRDLIEALVASGDSHGKYLQAIFEYNLALGALEKAVGAPVVSAPSGSAP